MASNKIILFCWIIDWDVVLRRGVPFETIAPTLESVNWLWTVFFYLGSLKLARHYVKWKSSDNVVNQNMKLKGRGHFRKLLSEFKIPTHTLLGFIYFEYLFWGMRLRPLILIIIIKKCLLTPIILLLHLFFPSSHFYLNVRSLFIPFVLLAHFLFRLKFLH